MLKQRQEACLDCVKKCLESHGGKKPRSSAPSTPLCFFKIMIGNFGEALFLSPLVARELSDLRDENVDIEDSNGHSWGVKISLLDNSLAFKEGWEDFVSDHSVKIGELLVLNRESRSRFRVKIFATTGCERLEFDEKNKASERKRKSKIKTFLNSFSSQKSDGESEGSVKKKKPTKAAINNPPVSKTIHGKFAIEFQIKEVNALQTPVMENCLGRPQTTEIKSDAEVACQMVDERAVTCIESEPMNKEDLSMLPVENDIRLSDTNDSEASHTILGTEMIKVLVIEEQKGCFQHQENPVIYASQNPVQTKDVIEVPSVNLLASQDFETLSNAPETDNLVQNDKILPNHHACPVSRQILSKGQCNGCQCQDETEEDWPVIAHPFIGERVATENCLLETNTNKDPEIKQGEIKLNSLDLSDHEINCKEQDAEEVPDNVVLRLEETKSKCIGDTAGKPSEHEGFAYNVDGELQEISYTVMVEISDKLGDSMLKPITLCDTSRDGLACWTDREDTARIICSVSDHHLNDHSNENRNGIHIASSSLLNINSQIEPKFCSSGNLQVAAIASSHNDDKVMESSSSQSEKMPDLEDDEKLIPCPGVVLGSVKAESADPTDPSSPNSAKFEFSLTENAKSCLELPESLPYTLFKKFSGRKVVLLQDPLMRTWPVLYCESETFVGFLGGWEIFFVANNLKQGDTCELFVVACGPETMLGVRISRV